MSRAFVKEAEGKVEDLPDRPISGHRNLVTPEGVAAIEAALIRFENAQREAIVKNDALASAAMREVRYWRARRASAEVVRPRPMPDSYVHPEVFNSYMDGNLVREFKAKAESELRGAAQNLKPEEAAVLALLRGHLAIEAERPKRQRAKAA